MDMFIPDINKTAHKIVAKILLDKIIANEKFDNQDYLVLKIVLGDYLEKLGVFNNEISKRYNNRNRCNNRKNNRHN